MTITREAAQTLTLSPDPLNLTPNSSGEITITLGNPAPVGGETVALLATGISVVIPSEAVILEGATTTNFTVTSGTQIGSAIVSATLGTFESMTTVNVGEDSPQVNCKTATRTAAQTAKKYKKATKVVRKSCKASEVACQGALDDLETIFNQLNLDHSEIISSCGNN